MKNQALTIHFFTSYKAITIWACALLLSVTLPAQQTWTVSNRNDGTVVDFTSINEAVTAAAPGDTILIYPSQSSYLGSNDILTIDKPIHLLGLGYLLDTINQPTLAITYQHYDSYLAGELRFNQGASGGSLRSVRVGKRIRLYEVANFALETCHVGTIFLTGCQDVVIAKNFVSGSPYYGYSGGGSTKYPSLYLENASSGILISNNIFQYYSTNTYHYSFYMLSGSMGVVLRNNLFANDVRVYNASVYNNIFLNDGWVSGTNNTVQHNVFESGSSADNAAGNQYDVGPGTICVGHPSPGEYSFDARYQILPGSPAQGAGINGVDCGAFGGLRPYQLSGIYARPLIYEFIVPAEVEGNSIDVNVKVRTVH